MTKIYVMSHMTLGEYECEQDVPGVRDQEGPDFAAPQFVSVHTTLDSAILAGKESIDEDLRYEANNELDVSYDYGDWKVPSLPARPNMTLTARENLDVLGWIVIQEVDLKD